MKKRNQVMALSVASALITAFIFFNSFQNSVASNGATDSVLGFLAPVLNALDAVFGKADWFFLLRKAAHMAEFCALGITVRWLLYTMAEVAKRPLAAHAALYVLAVAVTDEFIQSFSDRTSAVYDVLIDFSGAMIGFAIVFFIRWLRQKKKKEVES